MPILSHRVSGMESDHIFLLPTLPEYVTFLSLPYNTTSVHVTNRRPLFTHLGEWNDKERRGCRQS